MNNNDSDFPFFITFSGAALMRFEQQHKYMKNEGCMKYFVFSKILIDLFEKHGI